MLYLKKKNGDLFRKTVAKHENKLLDKHGNYPTIYGTVNNSDQTQTFLAGLRHWEKPNQLNQIH